jgi:hypothetical protein
MLKWKILISVNSTKPIIILLFGYFVKYLKCLREAYMTARHNNIFLSLNYFHISYKLLYGKENHVNVGGLIPFFYLKGLYKKIP